MSRTSTLTPTDPVTFIVSRSIRPGQEDAYQRWVKDVSAELLHFEGSIGLDIHTPASGNPHEYCLIYRFDTYEHLNHWMESAERRAWLAKLDGLIEGDTRVEVVTGLEYWFQRAGITPARMPSRHKQALVSWLAIFPLTTLVATLLMPVIDPLPLLLRNMLVSGLVILLMTYLVMPRLTRLLAVWLYPRAP